jgi:hypothetical protein
LHRITFEETGRPTLIRDPADDDVLCYGSAWAEESPGRVFEAEVRLFVPKVGREARYSNFRAFGTSARIVPQP